jgi:hypothetical protein
MSATSPAAPDRGGTTPQHAAASRLPVWRRSVEVVFGITGAMALFLGAFVQFAGEEQSIGFFGVWSTRAEDVSEAWTYALLAGGSLLLALSFALAALRRSHGRATAPRASRAYATLAILGLAAALVFAVLWAL